MRQAVDVSELEMRARVAATAAQTSALRRPERRAALFRMPPVSRSGTIVRTRGVTGVIP